MELEKIESTVYRLCSNADNKTDMECLECVKTLLNKQKPMKPIVSRNGSLICPTCGEPLHPTKWCDCGQLIDWSDDEVELPTEIVMIPAVRMTQKEVVST